MQTKLTLRLDAELIEQAKEQARRNGKSLSQLVSDYFMQLGRAPAALPLPPTVASLKGSLRAADARQPDERDYRAHLEGKHR